MTVQPTPVHRGHTLLQRELSRFVRFRWVAGACAVAGALVEAKWLANPSAGIRIGCTGLAILAYNTVLWLIMRQPMQAPARSMRAVAAIQILLDLTSLTLLVLWTGDLLSPLLGLYVLHMVFASLLLPRTMAYGSAAAAMGLLISGSALMGNVPRESRELAALAGEAVTLVATVYLTNHITRGLRSRQRRLIRQNRRIRALSLRLKRQQRAMVQHDKMVAMGQMAAGIAHEIANPLASMDSVLQLLERRPERLKPDTIATLRQQAERISTIIRQMKEFAHPAATQLQTLPLNDVVEQVLQMVQLDHRIRRIEVIREFASNAGQVPLLPQAIHQVLINLIMNAIDAMAEAPTPRLVLKTESQPGWRLIHVTDNGHGIARQHRERLFEPFFTTKPVGKGTGLGLSISYALVRKHRGSITVRSQVGSGTTFTVRLPAPELADGGNGRIDSSATILPSRDREAVNHVCASSENPALPPA